jgi:hypothetical protein
MQQLARSAESLGRAEAPLLHSVGHCWLYSQWSGHWVPNAEALRETNVLSTQGYGLEKTRQEGWTKCCTCCQPQLPAQEKRQAEASGAWQGVGPFSITEHRLSQGHAHQPHPVRCASSVVACKQRLQTHLSLAQVDNRESV